MAKKSYTLHEAMELLKISKPTVYSWSNKGTIGFEETPKGRLFIIDDSLIEKQQKLNEIKPSKTESDKSVKTEENLPNQTVNTSNEIVVNLLNQLNEKTAQLVMYAEERGKVKLLTDKLLDDKELLRQLNSDNKYYQDQLFEYKYKNKVLEDKINELEAKLKEKESDIKETVRKNGKENILFTPISKIIAKL